MSMGYEWEKPHTAGKWRFEIAGISVGRLALVFGIVAVALGVITTPLLLNESSHMTAGSRVGVDTMSTGSIRPNNGLLPIQMVDGFGTY